MHAREVVLVSTLVLLTACAGLEETQTRPVTIGSAARSWPAVQIAVPDAPPRILAAQVSSAAIRPGEWWSGKVVTTSNVAVVELRAPSFSFILHRPAFGEFNFRTHVLAVPSIYRRGFVASIVARNAAGQTDVRTVGLMF